MIGYCSALLAQSVASSVILSLWPGCWRRYLKPLSCLLALLSVAIVAAMFYSFDSQFSQFQFVERVDWIDALAAEYYVGVDGLSLLLVALTVFANVLVVLSQDSLYARVEQSYLALFFLMQAVTVGVFVALDGVLFYLFWESTLLPMYMAVGIWGSKDRLYAASKFFLFTFAGSLLLLLAIVYLGLQAESFALPVWYDLPLTWLEQCLLFVMFSAAFAVKLPMFPVHIWLPDAHTEAPAAGSLILAALLLKVGAFGFLRFNLPITPDASATFAPVMVVLSIIAVLYIGLLALSQQDIKRLIAYASISHMGMVTLGIFSVYLIATEVAFAKEMALLGACVQMIAHAFSSGGMFLAFGMLYARYPKRAMSDYGGLADTMPIFVVFFVWFTLSNIGLPGTAGFVGELMIFMSSFYIHPFMSAMVVITVLLSASYSLWMVRRVFYGPVQVAALHTLEDLHYREMLPLGLIGVAILGLGCLPQVLMGYLTPSVQQLLTWSLVSKII
mgnify:CR=1 FL=1